MKKILLILSLFIAISATAGDAKTVCVAVAEQMPESIIVTTEQPVVVKKKVIKHRHKRHPHKKRVVRTKVIAPPGPRPVIVVPAR